MGDKVEFKDAIDSIINNIIENGEKELESLSETELEKFWYFVFASKKTLESNLYEFTEMLRLYSSQCRRWEEKHNGTCCVVERVRDKYLMPKIKGFMDNVREYLY